MAAPQTYPSGSQQITPVSGQIAISDGPQISQFQAVSGTFTANGATAVTVAVPQINLTSIINISLNTVGGTVGALPAVKTITAGTGFTVAATAGDTSVYNWLILG
jgi:hypothetical protein